MFDMQRTGKTISNLRKARNMTQMELADRLSISFQAVSNWERGQTMPDIGKLGEISQILGVSIDELLGNGGSAHVMEKLVREEPVEEELTAEEFLDVAPLVKPTQAEKLWGNVKADVSLKELTMAAPFLLEGTVDDLAVRAAKREKSFMPMAGLLPFMSREAVDKCMEYVLDGELDIKKVMMAAPFMGKDSLSRLADRVMKDGGVKDMVMLAPFLKKKKITEAASFFIEKYGFSKIIPLLPFLDKELMDGFFNGRSKNED